MLRTLLKKASKKDGFTLIELIVVVAILGILAILLTPKLLTTMDYARVNGAASSATQVGTAMERYQVDYRSYPPNDATQAANLAPYLGNYTNIQSSNFASVTYHVYTNKQNLGTSACATKCAWYEMTITANDTGSTPIVVSPDGVVYSPPQS